MINEPLVSVIIPSFNYEKFIGEAIESVINQSYTNWELIIVDDASTDNSVNVIKQYEERYPNQIKLIAQEKNRGPSFAANLAYSYCSGEFVAHLGADDRMRPERLAHQVDCFLEFPNVAAICTRVDVINQHGESLGEHPVFSKKVTDLKTQLLEGNFLNSPSAMYRRSALLEIGSYNPALTYVQDFDHWLRAVDKFDVIRLDELLTDYRVHGNNLSIRTTDPGTMTYAGTYETVISILRAVKRRDNELDNSTFNDDLIVQKKLFLAKAAKKAERLFLGRFNYSVTTVYMILLDILEIDADHVEANELLKEVYVAIGDQPRAQGEKPITIEEYRLQRKLTGGSISDDTQEKLTTVREIARKFDISIHVSQLVSTTIDLAKIVKDSFIDCVGLIYDALKEQQQKTDYLSTIASIVIEGDFEEYAFVSKKVDLYTQLCVLSLKSENRAAPKLTDMRIKLRASRDDVMYETWRHNHALLEIDAQLHAERMMNWGHQPVFHIITLMYDGQQNLLANTIDSLSQQLYGNWKLTVIGDGPAPDPLFDEVEVLEWVSFPDGADLYDFLNTHISTQLDEWLLFAPMGIELEPHYFLKLGDYINLQSEKVVFYVDDDAIDEQGKYTQPRFKPDFNLDLLRSMDYLGVVLCRHDFFVSVGGFDAVPGYEHISITFKAFENLGANAIGHIDDLLVHLPDKSQFENGQIFKQAVHNHLLRSEVPAQVLDGLLPTTARVAYFHEKQPKISIIIPTKDKLEFLKPCIESVLTKTNYSDFEVLIVDNQSESPDTFDYFEEVTAHYPDKVTLLRYPYPFNYAAIINTAVARAQGEYLVLLNNDTEVLQADWVERMLMHAQRPEVGAVGVRLVYPETALIQHAGVIVGLNATADHPYNGLLNIEEPGYMGRAQVDQNYSAVTAACLMVSKDHFMAVGGMDEKAFAINFNDVDLCLKLYESGLFNVWTPYVTLIHHGSVSQKSIFKKDQDAWNKRLELAKKENTNFFKKWRHISQRDPAYNRHLQLSSSDIRLEYEIPGNWDINFHERKRVLGLPLSGGSGEYRVIHPFRALSQAALAQCEYYRFGRDQSKPIHISEYARLAPDVVVFQAAINDVQLQQIDVLQRYLPEVKRIYTVDDLLTNIPEKSPVYLEIQRNFRDAKSRLRQALASCDRLIVSTKPLAELSKDLIDDIRVIPNRLPRDKWCSLISERQQSDKPRVGWAGAQQHQGDLAIIIDVVKALADEVDWVFMGMCPDELQPYIKEFHPFVAIDDYPEKLASLNLDLALAPLELHPFNESKSNLRLLEYGVLGWPVIATDIYPYRTNNPPIITVQNEFEDWLTAIRNALSDKASLYQLGDELKQWVLDNYILEEHLDDWLSALTD